MVESKQDIIDVVVEKLKPNAYMEEHSSWKKLRKGLEKMTKDQVRWLEVLMLSKRKEKPKGITLECWKDKKTKNRWLVEYNGEVVATINYHSMMAYRSYSVEYFENCPFKTSRKSMTYETFYSAWLGVNKKALEDKAFKAIRD